MPLPSPNPSGHASTKRVKSKGRLNIMVFLDMNTGAWREVFLGIADYANAHGPWVLQLGDLRHIGKEGHYPYNADGCVAAMGSPWSLEQLRQLNIPAVNVSGNQPVEDFPSVLPDNREVGVMASRYFMSRGFRHLACVPHSTLISSRQRMEGFKETLVNSGFPPPMELISSQTVAENKRTVERRQIDAWLRKLPKPCGVFAFNDATAKAILERCRQLQLSVPSDLALLGVDNDPLICETSFPPLSSVNPNFRKVGQIAAAHLHHLLMGQPSKAGDVTRVQPLGIQSRHSTDILAVEDPIVAEALRFIRDQTGNPIGVNDVVQHASVSRRMLERRFSEALGHTLHEEIQHTRIEKAKGLLTAGGHTVEEISEACGFAYAAHFTQVFRRNLGRTPSAYRKEMAQSRLPPDREI